MRIVTTTDSAAMTNEQAIRDIKAFTFQDSPQVLCAVDLCIHDVEAFSVEDWVTWTNGNIIKLFYDMAAEMTEDLIDVIESNMVGEELIDNTIGGEQTERIDALREAKRVVKGPVEMFLVLRHYIIIHEHIKKIEEDEQDPY